MIVAFLGCSSDSSDNSNSCTPIPCYNGGTSNADCGCDCPYGYEGINCSIQKVPTSILITKIRVLQFPNKTLSNSSWDLAGNAPDITIKLQKGIKPFELLYESPSFFPDAVSNSATAYNFIPSIPIDITDINSPYIISILDYDQSDAIVSEDDYMGGIIFDIYKQGNNFPATITVKNTDSQLEFELSLSYLY